MTRTKEREMKQKSKTLAFGIKDKIDAVEKILVNESYFHRDKRTNKPILILKNKDYKRIALSIVKMLHITELKRGK